MNYNKNVSFKLALARQMKYTKSSMIEFRKLIRGQIEYRFDPLTNEQARLNPARAGRIKQAEGGGSQLGELIERSKEICQFCPERVEKETPCFPQKIWEEGRIRVGESLVFPNLNPFGECHAVAILSREHFLNPDEFSPQMIKDNLLAAKRYILSVHAQNKEARYPIYMWNYMPPSGGSIIHPHVQILVEREPTPQVSQLLQKSLEYYARSGENYWRNLAQEERRLDERFLAGDDHISVTASFAPRGFNEVCFIFNEISSLAEMDEGRMESFSVYLSRALRAYKEIGVGSFNLVIFSGPIGGNESYFYWMSAKLISRPYPQGIYTSDTGSMERLQDVWVIDTLPEELARRMKPLLRAQTS